jgi:uncharacterized protein YcbK (DUF882 family)
MEGPLVDAFTPRTPRTPRDSLAEPAVRPASRARGAFVASVAAGAACAMIFAGQLARDPRTPHSDGLACKKATVESETEPALPRPSLLATLAQTHTGERVLLDESSPPEPRFDALLADRVTGAQHAFDPRLLGLLRTMATLPEFAEAGLPRIELVSGFRSPKLNEMMRKKGHHVASHSQHSLGHAVDFRIVPAGATLGVDPRELERAIRATGWDGGVGVYTLKDDWFVHADVGPNRSWHEGPP